MCVCVSVCLSVSVVCDGGHGAEERKKEREKKKGQGRRGVWEKSGGKKRNRAKQAKPRAACLHGILNVRRQSLS